MTTISRARSAVVAALVSVCIISGCSAYTDIKMVRPEDAKQELSTEPQCRHKPGGYGDLAVITLKNDGQLPWIAVCQVTDEYIEICPANGKYAIPGVEAVKTRYGGMNVPIADIKEIERRRWIMKPCTSPWGLGKIF